MTSPSLIERSFTMTRPARLTLLNVSGQIDIQGGDGDTLTVTAVKHPGRGFDQTEIEIEQAADGAVRVATRYDDDIVSRLLGRRHSEPCQVDYTVRLPRAASVDVAYVSGAAYVANVHGELDLGSVSGPLDVADLGGTVQLKTVSGEIHAARLTLEKALLLETVSGEVVVADSALPGLNASSASGDLYIESHRATGAYRISTVSGDITLRLPADAQGVVQLHTLSGTLHSALPGLQRRGGSGTGEGVTVNANSVSGDLQITSVAGEGAATAALAAPVPAAPPLAERLALLDRIARGEVSVDEALKNLHA